MFVESRKPLGVILVEEGAVTEDQIQEALAYQKQNGGALGQVLQDLGYVTEFEILMALGSQVGMEVVDLDEVEASPVALSMVSKMMAEVYSIFPIRFEDGELVVAMADPLNVPALDDLHFMLNCEVRGAVANPQQVTEAIQNYYANEKDESFDDLINEIDDDSIMEIDNQDEDISAQNLEQMAGSEGIKKLLNLVLLTAIRDQAADIHFEPFEDTFKIRYRIDGVLLEMKAPHKNLALALISRIKVMSELNIAERRLPQDGRIALNMAGRSIDLRVSTLPTMFGESVVLRLLDRSQVGLDLHRLGMREETLETFRALIHRPNGIVLVTGPTGSGKTTTLYSCLNEANDIRDKIITTEDPVEYDLPGIIQVPIREDIGVTYSSCLRAILRQDPDKILVGEIRDRETAGIAIEAALTGHLVFSTLHTQDAPSTIARLIDMGCEPFMLAATVEAIIAQRLVRSICAECKTSYNPTEEELYQINLTPETVEGRLFYYGKGCPACKNTGYKGRSALYEIMIMDSRLRELILLKKSTEIIRAAANEQGMHCLRDAGLLKVFDGITTIEEIVRETMNAD